MTCKAGRIKACLLFSSFFFSVNFRFTTLSSVYHSAIIDTHTYNILFENDAMECVQTLCQYRVPTALKKCTRFTRMSLNNKMTVESVQLKHLNDAL